MSQFARLAFWAWFAAANADDPSSSMPSAKTVAVESTGPGGPREPQMPLSQSYDQVIADVLVRKERVADQISVLRMAPLGRAEARTLLALELEHSALEQIFLGLTTIKRLGDLDAR